MRTQWQRIFAIALAALLLASAAGAQTPAPQSTQTIELEHLIATLQDDGARERLIAELRSLLEAQRRLEPQPEPMAATQETVTGRLLGLLADQFDAINRAGHALAALVADVPSVSLRFADAFADPDSRGRIFAIGATVIAVLFVSWLAEWLVRRGLRPAHARLESGKRQNGWARLPLAVLAWLLSLLPLLAFGVVAYMILATLGGDSPAGLAVAALVNAYLLARAVNLTAAAVLSPGSA